MIRKAGMEDAGAIAAFLEGHIETSMFLLGNLEAHGTDDRDHVHGTAFFLRETGEGITGVFGATNGGFLLCQLPGLTATEAQTYAHLLKGYTLSGMTGAAEQVQTVVEALPLRAEDWRMNAVQPLFRRAVGPGDAHAGVRRAEAADVPALVPWFRDLMAETGVQDPGDPDEVARARAARSVLAGRLWLLEDAGVPVAMAGINARAGSAVQLGSVWTPPEARRRGYARRVIAGMLAELAGEGVTRAMLFSASDGASEMYEGLGFERCGDYRVALLAQPVTLGNPA